MVVLGIYRKQTIKGGTRIHSVGVDFARDLIVEDLISLVT